MADTPPPAAPAGQRFGLNRNVVVLMAVILVVGTGEELWVRFLPAYLEALGGGVWVVAAIGCCLVAVLLMTFLCREGPARPHEPIRMRGVWRSFDARLRRLLVADILARWAEGIPKVFVVIYCTQHLGLSALAFGWLM